MITINVYYLLIFLSIFSTFFQSMQCLQCKVLVYTLRTNCRAPDSKEVGYGIRMRHMQERIQVKIK